MSRSGALSHGFKRVWNDPLLFGAELAWRWAFALAFLLLLVYGVLLFLHSLPVSDKNLFRLSGILPGLYLDALASIFRGSGPKLVKLTAALIFGGSILWLLSSAWGRTITLADLQNRSVRVADISRFHLLRVVLNLLSYAAYFGSAVFAVSVASSGPSFDLSDFYAVLLPSWLLVSLVRGTLGWWVSLAPFVEPRKSTLQTLLAAADLARERGSQFAWVNLALGALRFVNLIAAWMVAFSLLLSLAELPDAYTWAALCLVVIVYSLIKNWLNTWELAAYARVIEWDGVDLRTVEYAPVVRPPLLDPPVIPAM